MILLPVPTTVFVALLAGGFVFHQLRRRGMRSLMGSGLVAGVGVFLGTWLLLVGVDLAALFVP